MLKHDSKLNPKIFDKNVELGSVRQGFGLGIVRAGEIDKNVVALCADLTESLQLDKFKAKFPNRFIEVGVAEQNLVTIASGMARAGKIPFIGSYAVFSPGRNWEQIRTTVCYNNLPVKIIGSHAGVTVGPDGGSHQALEDIALMRVLPRMVVISPCDALEAYKATIAAAKTADPTYIRLARDKTPIISTESTPFDIGKAQVVYESDITSNIHNTRKSSLEMNGPKHKFDVGIIATGPSVYRALMVARKLDRELKRVKVLNVSTIKPLDEHAVLSIAHDSRSLVTVEDHQISGGLGSVIAEFLSHNFPTHIEYIGIRDQFGQSGTPEELVEHYRIGENDIYDAAHRVMLRK
ncbi:MAG: transketolase C-terminal domain-containing protein [Candidatus Taylorbacteria bacterium]